MTLGVPVYRSQRSQMNLKAHLAQTTRGYAFSGPEGMGQKLTGGEAFKKVRLLFTSLYPAMMNTISIVSILYT